MHAKWPATLDALCGKRVLVVGDAAESDELRAVLRLAGARVMASTDVDVALTILARFAIDVVIADPQLRAGRARRSRPSCSTPAVRAPAHTCSSCPRCTPTSRSTRCPASRADSVGDATSRAAAPPGA